jgi:hypothetical protein
MTRPGSELDRLAAARPEAATRTWAIADEDARRDLLAAITTDAGREPNRPRDHRWLAGAAAAAAVAAVGIAAAAIAIPGSAGAPPGGTGIRTTAYVVGATEHALASTQDVVEMHVTVSTGVAYNRWFDVPTGAFRSDSYLQGRRRYTLYLEHGRAVVVSYASRQWYYVTESVSIAGEQMSTPGSVRQLLRSGRFRLAGRRTIDGQRCLELQGQATSVRPRLWKATVDLWVNAKTFLPVLQTTYTTRLDVPAGRGQHVTVQTSYAWERVGPASTAVFKIAIPAGFKHLAAATTG